MTNSDEEDVTRERELVLSRTFDAPRERVFAACSSCQELSEWWGPRSWPTAECSLDFRVGGVGRHHRDAGQPGRTPGAGRLTPFRRGEDR